MLSNTPYKFRTKQGTIQEVYSSNNPPPSVQAALNTTTELLPISPALTIVKGIDYKEITFSTTFTQAATFRYKFAKVEGRIVDDLYGFAYFQMCTSTKCQIIFIASTGFVLDSTIRFTV